MFITPRQLPKKRKSIQSSFVSPLNSLRNTSQSSIHATLVKASLFVDIEESIKTSLSNHLGDYCKVVELSDTQLTLSVPNAALATKIRQMIPSLAQELSQKNVIIKKITIKVMNNSDIPSNGLTPSSSPLAQTQPITQKACHEAYLSLIEHSPDSYLADALKSILAKRQTP